MSELPKKRSRKVTSEISAEANSPKYATGDIGYEHHELKRTKRISIPAGGI